MAGEFLTLGGLDIPIRDKTVGQSYDAVGGYGKRAHSGNFRAEARGLVDGLDMTTKQLTYAEIKKLRAWLLGLGFSASFDADLYSHNGIGPDPGFSTVITVSGGKFAGYATVASATFLIYQLGAGFGNVCTFGVWKQVGGGGWNHYVTVDNGGAITQYKNGLPHVTIPADDPDEWMICTGNVLRLEGKDIDGTAFNSDYDDLFAVPWEASAADVAAWYANTQPFSPLPAHTMSGAVIGDDVRTVNVSSLQGGVLQFGDAAGWHQNAQQLTFTLQEKIRRTL
jgi:hypothetical protein